MLKDYLKHFFFVLFTNNNKYMTPSIRELLQQHIFI